MANLRKCVEGGTSDHAIFRHGELNDRIWFVQSVRSDSKHAEWHPLEIGRCVSGERRGLIDQLHRLLIERRGRFVPLSIDVDHTVVGVDILTRTVVPVVRRGPAVDEPAA